jgi:hypothetical protein
MFPVRYELSFYILLTRYSVFKGLIEHVTVKIWVWWRYSSTIPDLGIRWVCCQIHTLVPPSPGKQRLVPTEWESAWISEIWTLRRREQFFPLLGKKPHRPTRSLHFTYWIILVLCTRANKIIFSENSGRYMVERRAIWTIFLCVNVALFSASQLQFQLPSCGAMSWQIRVHEGGMDRNYWLL